MQLTTYLQVFCVGLAGGSALELLHWFALRTDSLFPAYAMSAKYWIVTVLMVVAGGGLALLYFGARAEGLVVAHVGLSAPLLIQKLASVAFEPKGASAGGLSMWSFFRW